MAVILDLPPGTLTQRTLIYAVRTHPERPASADGQPCLITGRGPEPIAIPGEDPPCKGIISGPRVFGEF